MTFLNDLLLFGLAAAAIPVLIHLLHRSRPKVVRWGATHLLQASIARRSRRIRLEQLLLILVRAAILAGLALLMARPVLTRTAGLSGLSGLSGVAGGRLAAAVVVDVSYSMAGGGQFEAARAAASALLGGLRAGDAAAVVLAGSVPVLPMTEIVDDPERCHQALQEAEPVYGRAQIVKALEAAYGLLQKAAAPQKEIFLLSDFQKYNWIDAERRALKELARKWQGEKVPPAVRFVPVEASSSVVENFSIEALEIGDALVAPGKSVPIKVKVLNRGSRAYPKLSVQLTVDGFDERAAEIPLAASSTQEVAFEIAFSKPGCHTLEARLPDDALPGDNRWWRSVETSEEMRVLLVDGDPKPQPLGGEVDYLRLALAPFLAATSGKGAAGRNPFQVRVCKTEDLQDQIPQDYRVIVLANVRALAEGAAARLLEFVSQGGGLLICAGDRIDADFYNRAFLGGPGRLFSVSIASPPLAEAGLQGGAAIQLEAERHPALAAAFSSSRELDPARVWGWLRLEEPSTGGEGGGAQVLLRLSTGDPLLVEGRSGRGRALLCATACDEAWSNLPLRPFYAPLFQQLVAYLACGREAQLNLEPGEPLLAAFPASSAGKEAIIRTPGGQEARSLAVERGGRAVVEYRHTAAPGLYTVLPAGDPPMVFSVNAGREESDLDRLSAAELEGLAAEAGGKILKAGAGFKEQLESQRRGAELWKPLLAAVIAFLFLELLLEQKFEGK